jgi:phage-related protein
MERVKIAIDEAKESIGAALLPILEKLLGLITEKALPFLNKFVEGFQNVTKSVDVDLGGALQYLQKIFTPIFKGIKMAFDTVSSAIDRNREKLQPLFDLFKALAEFTRDILIPILAIGLGEAFKIIGQIIGGIIDIIALMVDAIAKSIQTIQNFINKIQEAIDKANSIPVVGAFIPDSLTRNAKPTVIINNNVKGAVDPQATARAITKVTNTAAQTTGLKPFFYGFR